MGIFIKRIFRKNKILYLALIIGSVLVLVAFLVVYLAIKNAKVPSESLTKETANATLENKANPTQEQNLTPSLAVSTTTPTPKPKTQSLSKPTVTTTLVPSSTPSPTPTTPTPQYSAAITDPPSPLIKGDHAVFRVEANFSIQECHYRLIRPDGERVNGGQVYGNGNICSGSFVVPNYSFRLEISPTPNLSGTLAKEFIVN